MDPPPRLSDHLGQATGKEVAPGDLGRTILRCCLIVFGLGAVYALLPFKGDRWWIGALVGLGAWVSSVPFTVKRIRRVLVSDRPVFEAVEAVVLLVTLLVLGFSMLYLGLDGLDGQFAGLETRIDALYFTVTTLSTVGFGDIHATGQGSRLIVAFQILFNLSVVAVAVRVVAGAARHRLNQER